MKYEVEVMMKGTLVVEANTPEEAREMVEEGFSVSDVSFEDTEIDDIYPVPISL